MRAYQLVGFTPARDRLLLHRHHPRAAHPHAEVVGTSVQQIIDLGGSVSQGPDSELLSVSKEFTVYTSVARCWRDGCRGLARRPRASAYRILNFLE